MFCSYGCGKEAKFQMKNGKFCCSDNWIKCNESKNKLSKRMKENNPLFNPIYREKQKIANGSESCRKKKSDYSKKFNPMFREDVKQKHKESMKLLCGENNPLYTNPEALENLRKAEIS